MMAQCLLAGRVRGDNRHVRLGASREIKRRYEVNLSVEYCKASHLELTLVTRRHGELFSEGGLGQGGGAGSFGSRHGERGRSDVL